MSIKLFAIAGLAASGVAIGYVAYSLSAGARVMEKKEIVLGGEVFSVEFADTFALRERGLSGRPSLGDREGMLFEFGTPAIQRFWMRGMRFPIDIVWIRDERVVGVERGVAPEEGVPLWRLRRYASPVSVNRVLEVAAGTSDRLGLREGDSIVAR